MTVPGLPVVLLVLLAGVMHAGWNAVVKGGADRVLTMAAVAGVGGAVAVAMLPFTQVPSRASWPFLALSGLIHVGYFTFLLQAYRIGDLGHVYPVARGAAPLMVGVAALLAAGERPGVREMVGLAVVAASVASFALERRADRPGDPRVFLLALATAAVIGTYTVVDGLGVRRSSAPLGYILWILALDGLPLVAYALVTRRGRVVPYVRGHWPALLAGGLMCGGAYGLVIWALGRGAMAHVAALRETSVVFAALLGWRFLGEPLGPRRFLAALGVAAGLLLLHGA